ncbi:unnamed protein product [Clavelina lepadiformis]|uniref:Secreted protein n=1 Tax=Clavelina lepadiformis TaxID=159417 RepID=A0ABP0F954_CLALP
MCRFVFIFAFQTRNKTVHSENECVLMLLHLEGMTCNFLKSSVARLKMPHAPLVENRCNAKRLYENVGNTGVLNSFFVNNVQGYTAYSNAFYNTLRILRF